MPRTASACRRFSGSDVVDPAARAQAMATSTPKPSKQLTRAVRDSAKRQGLAPELFTAGRMANGAVWVRGPRSTAIYPPDGWLQKFTRHLALGLFDVPRNG